MTVQIIPTLTDGTIFYNQTTVLDGRTYQLSFHYNSRDAYWYLNIRTEAGDAIRGCGSLRLVQGSFPIRRVYDVNRPSGELLVLSELKDEPGLVDLGNDTVLAYIPRADVEAIFA